MTRLLGARVERLEDPRLLTGRGRYLADIERPGMLHAAFVRSPHAHARIRGVDAAAARDLRGVAAVLTAADLNGAPLVDTVAVPGLSRTPQPALATDRVRFQGEAVAIVVAGDRYVAEDAAELVTVDYEPLPVVLDAEAVANGVMAAALFDDLPSNVVYRGVMDAGDPDTAFADADHVISARYHGNRFVAVPMEGRGCLAEYDAGAGELTVWCSTQGPHLLRRRLASTTGIREARIRVVVPDVGGAFGQKIPAHAEEIAVVLAARVVGQPVRWVEDRLENLQAAPHAKEQIVDAELALAADGTFLAMRARIVGDAGAYSHNSASALVEPYLSAGLMPGVYTLRHYRCEIVAALTNKSPISPYRGVGWTAGHTARELVIDRAARVLGRDPAQLRRQNMVPRDAFPYTSCTGMVYDSGSFTESLDRALAMVGYEELRRVQGATRAAGRPVGIGISPYVEPTGWGSEGSMQSSWSFASHDDVRIEIAPSGDVLAAVGTPSQGQGHATMLAQIVADRLGAALEDVHVIADDTRAAPISTAGTRASRTAVVIGGALSTVACRLRAKLDAIAAHLLEAAPEDIVAVGGIFSVAGSPDAAVTLRQVAEAAHFDPGLRDRLPDPSLTDSGSYDPKATYSNGCVAAVVEVDVETGAIQVRRLVAVEDCGTVINPMLVEGQMSGALAQGVGGALLEAMRYDADGRLLTSDLRTYKVPKATDLPALEIGHECSPSPHSVDGVKGMGESGVISAPAAVANAVADAVAHLGIDIARLPIDSGLIASTTKGT